MSVSTKKQAKITRDGSLSIRGAGELSEDLLDALQSHETVVVDFKAVTAVDITILQVLIAAHKSAAELDVSLRIEAKKTSALKKALVVSGIAAGRDLSLRWDKDVWTGFDQLQSESAA